MSIKNTTLMIALSTITIAVSSSENAWEDIDQEIRDYMSKNIQSLTVGVGFILGHDDFYVDCINEHYTPVTIYGLSEEVSEKIQNSSLSLFSDGSIDYLGDGQVFTRWLRV